MNFSAAVEFDLDTLPATLRPWLQGLSDPVEEPLRGFVLRFFDDRLRLRAADAGLGELAIDFDRGQAGYRGARARNERLVRACGIRAGSRVVDATGGLGTDAWLLASAGARLTLIEHHPVVAALLADGLRRAAVGHPDIVERIELMVADSRQVLPNWPQPLTAIYLDPMYPPRRKSALGDRRLRLLAALFAAGTAAARGDDVAGLLAAAHAAPTARVVLKRPQREALPAGAPVPDYSLEGRSTRFDVWRRADRTLVPWGG